MKKKNFYIKANKKLQINITKLKGKNTYLIAENASLEAKVVKLKGLCYLNKSEQSINISGIDKIDTNSGNSDI